MSTPAELLAQSLAKYRSANRIDGTRASYRKDNPGEFVSVMTYLDGGPRPGNVTSDMGMGLLLEEDARRVLAGGTPPPPPPPPPPSAYTYRFASFNPTSDKIGGTLNRFSYPSGSYWWTPGSPVPPNLSGATNWSKGGGIYEINHPTYGPGFSLVCDPDMVYPATQDTRICELYIDPKQASKFPTPIPFTEGTVHRWDWTWRRPSGQTWQTSASQVEGFLHGFYNNGQQSVGHHLYINPQPPFHYYVGREVTFTPPTGAWGNWEQTQCPIEFKPDEFHTIRWEIKYSTNGYMRAWTSVDGGSSTQWMNYSGSTIPAGFGGCYAIRQDIRPPLGGSTNTLEVYNWRLTIS